MLSAQKLRPEKVEVEWTARNAVVMTCRYRQEKIRKQIQELEEAGGRHKTEVENALDELKNVLHTFLKELPADLPLFTQDFRTILSRPRRRPVRVFALDRWCDPEHLDELNLLAWVVWPSGSSDFVRCHRLDGALTIWTRPSRNTSVWRALEKFNFTALVDAVRSAVPSGT